MTFSPYVNKLSQKPKKKNPNLIILQFKRFFYLRKQKNYQMCEKMCLYLNSVISTHAKASIS